MSEDYGKYSGHGRLQKARSKNGQLNKKSIPERDE